LSTSSRNFSKAEIKIEAWIYMLQIQRLHVSPCARSTLSHKLLEEFNLQFLLCPNFHEKDDLTEVGVQNSQSNLFSNLQFLSEQGFFFSLRSNDRHFRFPGVINYALIQRCRPNSQKCFLHCRIYSLLFIRQISKFTNSPYFVVLFCKASANFSSLL
jgi:hypothetical protein